MIEKFNRGPIDDALLSEISIDDAAESKMTQLVRLVRSQFDCPEVATLPPFREEKLRSGTREIGFRPIALLLILRRIYARLLLFI